MAIQEEFVLKISAELADAKNQIAALESQLEALQGETTVSVGVDDQASETLDGVATTTSDLDGSEAEVAVEADDNATDALEDVEDLVGDLDGETAEVTVEADTVEATSGIEDIGGALDGVIGKFGELKELAASPAGALGAMAGGLLAATSAAYDFTQQVEELSLFTGESTEESSRLLGVLQDYTTIDIGRLEGQIGRVADKLQSMPELGQRLGVDLDAGPLQQFVQTVDALNSGQLEANERIAIGIDLFGRKGLAAVNEIKASLSGPLREAMQGVSEERIISEDDIARADRLEQGMGELKDQIAAVTQAIGEGLIPAMADLAAIAAPAIDAIGTGFRNQLAFISRFREDTSLLFGQIFGGGDETTRTFAQLVADLTTVSDTWDEVLEKLRDPRNAEIASTAFEATGLSIEQVITKLKELDPSFSASEEAILGFVATLGLTAPAAEETALNLDMVNAALADLEPVAERFPDLWGRMVEDLKDGKADSEGTAAGLELLSEATGMTVEQLLRLAKTDAAKALNETGDAAVDLAGDLPMTTAEIENLRQGLAVFPEAPQFASQWQIVIDALQSGGPITDTAANAVNGLANSLHLSQQEILDMAKAKLDEQLLDAAEAAEKLRQAIADVSAEIADVEADDVVNIGRALQDALDVADRPLDLEILKGNLSTAIDELQELVDEKGSLDWSEALADVRDQFQEGLVASFELGGRPAAEQFSAEFVQALSEQTGLSPAEIYATVGLPPDGNVEAFLRLSATAESKADAERILAGLKGVDPNNPIIAYITAALQTGGIDPVIAEIAALLLAQDLGVPVAPELLAFTPEQLAAAQAVIDANPVTVPTTLDPSGADADAAGFRSDQEGEPVTLTGDAQLDEAAQAYVDFITQPRSATVFGIADVQAAAATMNSFTSRQRTAPVLVDVIGEVAAEIILNNLARTRTAHINVQTHGVGAASSSVSSIPGVNTASATGLSAQPQTVPAGAASGGGVAVLAAPAPVTVVPQVTINAGVLGNHFDVERTVARALRRYQRVNGRR